MTLDDLSAGTIVVVPATCDLLSPRDPLFTLTLTTAGCSAPVRNLPGYAWIRGDTKDGNSRTSLIRLDKVWRSEDQPPRRIPNARPGTM